MKWVAAKGGGGGGGGVDEEEGREKIGQERWGRGCYKY